jgi:hypothetical protein
VLSQADWRYAHLAKVRREPNSRRIEKHEKSAEKCIWRSFKHLETGNHGKFSTQLISSREHLERDCFVLANFLLSTEH